MLVKDFECRSFKEARELLGDSLSRKVCSNTILRFRIDGWVGLYLHGNEIARLFPNGKITLDSCGYKTRTTQDRLNRILPRGWKVYQEKRQWFLRNTLLGTMFEDGMEVPV